MVIGVNKTGRPLSPFGKGGRRDMHRRNDCRGICRLLSVGLMIICLTLLTSMNFFLYASADEVVSSVVSTDSEDGNNNFPPSGPTEEKSSGQSFSFSEEILHETHPEFNFSISNHLYLHHIADADKIEMFHSERILQPPKL
jgi:hypothetical protein